MRNRAIVISDTEGTIRMWSEGAARLFGFAEQEAIGQKLDIVVPSHLRDDHWRGFHGAMASGVVHGEGQFSDIPGLHKTGDIRTFRVQLQLLRDEQKNPIGAMAIFTSLADAA